MTRDASDTDAASAADGDQSTTTDADRIVDAESAVREGAGGEVVSPPAAFRVAPFGATDGRLDTPRTPVGSELAVAPRRLLAALVATPSVSGDESAVAETLAAFFAAHDRPVRIDAAGNVRAPADDAVLLTGHLDTVPGDLPVRIASDDEPPWGGVRRPAGTATHTASDDTDEPQPGSDGASETHTASDDTDASDDVLHGRGSVDATGALAAMAVAAVATGVSFAGVTREESDGAGARYLVARREPPAAVINGEPSGWDAVTLAYRGLVRGRYRVERPTSHGARPEPNAIQLATAWWHRVERSFATDGPVAERVTATPTAFDGGVDGTTTQATVRATFRVPVGGRPADVRDAVRGVTTHGTVSWAASVPPVAASPRVAPAGALRAGIRAVGGEPRHLRKTGTADANRYAAAWDCPVVTYGPGDAALDHTPDERLPLAAFDRSVRVLAHAARRLR